MKKSKFNNFIKYTNIGLQMLVVILLAVFGGLKLDELCETDQVFTVVLSLVGVFAAIYLAIKDFIKLNK